MADIANETVEAIKRIKQLENQNTKLKGLLEAAVQLASQDAKGVTNLQSESDYLKAKVEDLEKEKYQLEQDLQIVLSGNDKDIAERIQALEKENIDLKSEFESVVNEIKKESLDLDTLKTEDDALKKILSQLEHERKHLLTKIEEVVDCSSSDNQTQIHNPNLEEGYSSEILPASQSLGDAYKNYVLSFEKQSNIQAKISELEKKNEEMVKEFQKTDSQTMRDQIKINGIILASNTNFLNEIDKARCKMQEIDTDKITDLEQAKSDLYRDLEQCLRHSSKEIEHLSDNISDPEIRRLINEIQIQKTMLLHSLQSTKLDTNVELPTARRSPSEEGSCSSREDHQKLEKEVDRLEKERKTLLEQLRSISATSANRIQEIVTRNERQLQTQSELHSTFMRESSHEIVPSQNYDDATNQLYADEDSRLEQRIRELEMENSRIQRELDGIMEEIRADKNEMSRLQFTGQVLRERLEDLEQSARGGRRKQ